MKGSLALIALAATGLFLGGARGAQADHQRDGYNRDDQGSGYQRSDWHTEQAVPQNQRQGRGAEGSAATWRSDTADRANERGRGGWGQSPVASNLETDRGHGAGANRPSTGSRFGERCGNSASRDGWANRSSDGTAGRGDQ